LTTVQGLPKKFDQKKILKVIKKKFACNGTIVADTEMGEVIQLQGDQRKDIQDFLTDKKEGLGLDAKTIKVSHARRVFTQTGVLIEYRSTVSKRYHVRLSSYRTPLQIGLRGKDVSPHTLFGARGTEAGTEGAARSAAWMGITGSFATCAGRRECFMRP
jgi:hypothetical protein